jgi:hypothetical protein
MTDRTYVMSMESERVTMPGRLAGPLSSTSWVLALAGIATAMVLAGTAALWAHYGTAVFYEMILSGIAACL